MLWIIPIPQNLIFLFYFQSKGIIFLAHLATDFLLEMKTATWDIFRFFILMERCFCLLLCNLFHKAAFMNFMFPEHCHITLLGPKCKTSLVITLNIQYLGKTFLLITACDLCLKCSITNCNVSTNLFWNFVQVRVRNAFNWPIKTLKSTFSSYQWRSNNEIMY